MESTNVAVKHRQRPEIDCVFTHRRGDRVALRQRYAPPGGASLWVASCAGRS
jgi:hypothetical protein